MSADQQMAKEEVINHPVEIDVTDPMNTLKSVQTVTSPQSDKKISRPSFLPSINNQESVNVTQEGQHMRELDELIKNTDS